MKFLHLTSLLAILAITSTSNAFAKDQKCANQVRPACLEQEMSDLFNEVENETARDSIGADLVLFLTNTGKYEQALDIADKMVEPYAKTNAVTSVIQRLSQVGRMDEAVRVLKEKLPETNDRLYALQTIGEHYLKDGNLEAALQLSELLSGEESLDNYYDSLVSNLIYDNRYKQAYELSARLSLPQKKASALRAIAERQATAGY